MLITAFGRVRGRVKSKEKWKKRRRGEVETAKKGLAFVLYKVPGT